MKFDLQKAAEEMTDKAYQAYLSKTIKTLGTVNKYGQYEFGGQLYVELKGRGMIPLDIIKNEVREQRAFHNPVVKVKEIVRFIIGSETSPEIATAIANASREK